MDATLFVPHQLYGADMWPTLYVYSIPVHPLLMSNELLATVHFPYEPESAMIYALPLWLAYCEYCQVVLDGEPVELNVEYLSWSGPVHPLSPRSFKLESVNVPPIHAGYVVEGCCQIDDARMTTSL